MPDRDTTRINERIRVPEVRVISDTGDQVGVMKTDEALRYAQERDLDLVEVAPDARPPVCRVLDYSKYKYEQAQKVKAARKHQQQITIREIKFRPKIAEHDYATKKGHVERFLRHKDKVKITIMFRGREVTHPERGTMILDRLAEDLAELATIEQRPNLDGRNMTMLLGPSKAVLADELPAKGAEAEAAPDPAPEAETAEAARTRRPRRPRLPHPRRSRPRLPHPRPRRPRRPPTRRRRRRRPTRTRPRLRSPIRRRRPRRRRPTTRRRKRRRQSLSLRPPSSRSRVFAILPRPSCRR